MHAFHMGGVGNQDARRLLIRRNFLRCAFAALMVAVYFYQPAKASVATVMVLVLLWLFIIEFDPLRKRFTAFRSNKRKITSAVAGGVLTLITLHPETAEQHLEAEEELFDEEDVPTLEVQESIEPTQLEQEMSADVTVRTVPGQQKDETPLSRIPLARNDSSSESRLSSLFFDATSEGLIVFDESLRIIKVNKAYVSISGYPADEVLGQSAEFLYQGIRTGRWLDEAARSISETGVWRGESLSRRKDGKAYRQSIVLNGVFCDDVRAMRYIGIISDCTEMHEKDRRIQYMAYHDELTGLPNRVLLQERLEQAIVRSKTTHSQLAVMLIDLDRFKFINDTMGHAAGDYLLQLTSSRLRSSLQSSDTVARMGGDEFIILIEDVPSQVVVSTQALSIIDALSKSFLINNRQVHIGASIGIAMFPDDGNDAQQLIKYADLAMYEAKSQGKNTFRFINQALTERAMRRHEIEMSLYEAIGRGGLELHYQPKICLATDGIIGVEALVRWRGKDGKLTPPGEFIHIAEETGLIVMLGDWVVNEACRQIALWNDIDQPINVSINVSALQLARGDLVATLSNAAERHQITLGQLQIELTESALMTDPEQATELFSRLRGLGIQIALDDFGTGYSSLACLQQLPLDVLKIDQAFIHRVCAHASDRQLVKGIVALGQSLGLEIVAEGVETLEQANLLRSLGCNHVQGYLYTRPLAVADFNEYIHDYLKSISKASHTDKHVHESVLSN